MSAKNIGSGDPVWEYVRPCQWSGIAVEPMPDTYAKLKDNYHDLEALNRVVTLNLGVSNSSGYTTMVGGGKWQCCPLK
jgi:FkbM family methyltransferase